MLLYSIELPDLWLTSWMPVPAREFQESVPHDQPWPEDLRCFRGFMIKMWKETAAFEMSCAFWKRLRMFSWVQGMSACPSMVYAILWWVFAWPKSQSPKVGVCDQRSKLTGAQREESYEGMGQSKIRVSWDLSPSWVNKLQHSDLLSTQLLIDPNPVRWLSPCLSDQLFCATVCCYAPDLHSALREPC